MNDIQPVPERSGTSQNGSNPAPYADKEWLTINEAVILFRYLGLPRTPEAIRKYCRQEKIKSQTVAGAKGDQHMVEQITIKPFIEDQLRALNSTSQTIPEHAGMSRNVPVHSVTTRNVPEQPETATGNEGLEKELAEAKKEIEELTHKNRVLEVDKQVREQWVGQLTKDRDQIMENAMKWSREVGQLEQQVKQLQLGSGESATEVVELQNESKTTKPATPVEGYSSQYTVPHRPSEVGSSETKEDRFPQHHSE